MKHTLVLILLFLLTNTLHGQLISIASTVPPGTEWRQIESDTVRIVYPSGMDLQARRLGGMIHYMARNHVQSLGDRVKKVDIFLLNQSANSNGYVATPPFHSKFYTQAPHQTIAGTTEWLDLLAIHEYRHVLQMSNSLNGITKWLYYAFGEILWTGAAHLAVPPWFWEGDAVVQETLLSHSGRGTLPGFLVDLKTISNLEKSFSYEKMVCGSYKDVIPNHYYLGYALSLHGRSSYGNDFWRGIYRDATAYRGIFWPFSEAIRANTGLRTKDLYQNMMESMSSDESESKLSLVYESSPGPGVPTTYRLPKFINTKQLVVLKRDYDRAEWFVKVDIDGHEEPIIPVGYGMGTFDVNQNQLVWNEITTHKRWSDMGYSNIFQYDFYSGKTRQLTRETRYFMPSISPDSKQLLVVESDEMMKNFLVFLDIKSGEVMRRFEEPGGAFVTYPCWYDDQNIVYIAQKNSLQSLLMFNIKTGQIDTLVNAQSRVLEYVSSTNGKIYYSTNTTNHSNQLISLDPKENYTVSSSLNMVPYLMEMPVASTAGHIAFINKRFNQNTLAIAEEKEVFEFQSKDKTIDQVDLIYQEGKYDYGLRRLSMAEGGKLPDSFSFKANEKKYQPGFSKLKLHSWIISPAIPNLSIMFQANDALGQVGVFVQPGFNLNEGAFFTNANISYGAYYPKFDLGLSTLLNRSAFFTGDDGPVSYSWNEFVLSTQISVPLSYTKRNYFYRLSPVLGYKYTRTSDFRDLGNPAYHIAYAAVTGAIQQRSAYRSIKPRFGISTNLSVQKVVNNQDKPVVDTDMKVYLPGLLPVHSSYFDFRFRYQDKGNEYLFLDSYYYANGFNLNRLTNWIAGAKAYYAFPIWYPDIAAGPFAFFKRLRMNVNYKLDVTPGLVDSAFGLYHHAGFELITDARYFRLFDFSVGFGLGVGFSEGQFRGFDFNLIFGE